jgi:alkanesulfonate monooxygenase SsuD/methylene tetrahydromethanopterin reductase-like flavin-dependent oxidoreductase (luciferase family)
VIELSLAYDMRAPDAGAAAADLYGAAVEQAAWADKLGFDKVTVMEHHATTDGYLPSPIVLGAAIAGVTEQVTVQLSLVLLPLYHPLRAAEDLAVLDLVSGGRMRLVVGLGYREEEYQQFDVNIRRRPSLMEEAVETLKLAWTGEPFEFRGQTVRILPRPAQRPRPGIAMGGASPASARRAARIADDYQPLAPRLYDIYLEELAALGKAPPPPPRWAGRGVYVYVSEDPERDWARIGPAALHDTNEYARWIGARRGTFEPMADTDELRRAGTYRVVTPDECLDLALEHGGLVFKPLVGGLDPAVGWAGLQLFADQVLPRLHQEGPPTD